MPIHFGVQVRAGKYGLELTRETYAQINKKSSFNDRMEDLEALGAYEPCDPIMYTDAWAEKHRQACLINFDNNMRYFETLDSKEFNNALDSFLLTNPSFMPVVDLNAYFGKPGYYILVLDKYKQCYIGTAKDIAKRIRQHWSGAKQFDRLLLPIGAVETSKLSIDSFRAFDTTRIFVFVSDHVFEYEYRYVNEIPAKFSLNRVQGGLQLEDGRFGSYNEMEMSLQHISEHAIPSSPIIQSYFSEGYIPQRKHLNKPVTDKNDEEERRRKQKQEYDWLDDPFDEKKAAKDAQGMSGTAKTALGCGCLLVVAAFVVLLAYAGFSMLDILAA